MYSYSRCLISFNNWVLLGPGISSVLKFSATADGFGAVLILLYSSSLCLGFLSLLVLLKVRNCDLISAFAFFKQRIL